MNLQAQQPPEKKRRRRKKKTAKFSSSPPPTPPFFSLLPVEIIENCLARVPSSYYPKLWLVSKSFRSFLSSTDLYAARSRLGLTQQCLYICLRASMLSYGEWFQWITLSIDPNLINKKERTIGQLSVPIPSSNCGTEAKPTVVGFEIYVIGGHRVPSSTVRVLDCRSHVWRDAPCMNVARGDPESCYYDGKIYVMGGFRKLEPGSPFAEVFDTKTQSWECLPDPGAEVRQRIVYGIVEIQGKIHLTCGDTLYAYYDPKQCKWENKSAIFPRSDCVMDNVSYSYKKHGNQYNLWWRDMNGGGDSKEVKGLYSLGNRYKSHGGSDRNRILASCGGKLYLMWMDYADNHMTKIWCAEISLEKRDGDEVWGNVEWLDVVHTTSITYSFFRCLPISL